MSTESVAVPETAIRGGRFSSFAIGTLAVLWPSFRLLAGGPVPRVLTSHSLGNTVLWEWAIAAILAFVVFKLQRIPLRTFHVRMLGRSDILPMFAGLVALFVAMGLASGLMGTSSFSLAAILAIPVYIRVAASVTAGICEEFLFRAVAFEEFRLAFGHEGLGAVIATIAFGLAHLGVYGLSAALVSPLASGAIFGALYLWRRRLTLCMALHFVIDLLLLVIIPGLARH